VNGRDGPVSRRPDNHRVAHRERLPEPGAIIACPTRLIGKEMARIHPGVEEGIALQIGRLAIIVTRHPHVAHEHVRKTTIFCFSYIYAIRQDSSYRFSRVFQGASRLCSRMSGTT